MVKQITLLLGGARSGKSALACSLASQPADQQITYIATAIAADQEMAERILRHQQDRPTNWHVVEAPFALAKPDRPALIIQRHPTHASSLTA